MANRRRSDSQRTSTPASPAAPQAAPTGTRAAASESRPSGRRAPAEARTAGTSGTREPISARGPVSLSAEARRAMIAEAAYLRAERRGFAPGSEEEDWLAAEKEVDALLSAGQTGPQ